jgi:hypothetical protein
MAGHEWLNEGGVESCFSGGDFFWAWPGGDYSMYYSTLANSPR